jgi:hypothetical protein
LGEIRQHLGVIFHELARQKGKSAIAIARKFGGRSRNA